MFKKNFKVRTESAIAMDLVKVLGKYGIKFEVTDEYFDEREVLREEKPYHTWYRDFNIRTTKRMMRRIWKEFKARVKTVNT